MKHYRISSKVLLLFSVFWVFYPPGYFVTALNLAGILNTLKYILSIAFLAIAFIQLFRKKTKPSRLSVLIVFFYIQLLLMTILNGGNLFDCFRYILPPIAVSFYYEYCNRVQKIRLIRALFWIHFVFMIVNLMSVIICPNGMYLVQGVTTEKYYFIGHNNAAARFLLPGVFYAIAYDYLEQNKMGWKTLVSATLSFLTVTLTWSNTGMVGLGLLLLSIILSTRMELPKLFTVKNVFILSAVLFFVVVVDNNVGVFDFLIEKVFHKEVTLSGRTYLWNAILNAIVKRPILGYGYGVSMGDIFTAGRYVASSGHNYFLDLLLRGGILQLVFQILIVLEVGRIVDKSHNKLSQLMISAMLSYVIMWQFEPFVNSGYIDMMLVFMIMTTLPALIDNDDQSGKKSARNSYSERHYQIYFEIVACIWYTTFAEVCHNE